MWSGNSKQNQLKLIAFITLLDAVTSQIYIDYLVSGFRVSVSVIILPVIYYYYRRTNPIITSIFIGIFGVLFRGLLGMGMYGTFAKAVMADYQILVFDLTYGILFYFLFYVVKEKTILKWIFAVWFCDFTANFIEMSLRVGSIFSQDDNIVNRLITVGFLRTSIACFLVFAFKYYQLISQKESKYEKYRAFYSVFADLKSETYFMKENMDYIEDVMCEAYQLYEHCASTEDEKAKHISLKIAKDVHEIKKNYNKVIDGINKIGKHEETYDYVDLKELILLLRDYYGYEKTNTPVTIEIEDNLVSNYSIKKHFLMMSVMRNLVSNSFESMSENSKNNYIKLRISDSDEHINMVIQDTGRGIKEKDVHVIFEPGFSTKFNEETGDVYRGLGLTLVKDIVVNQFNGSIHIKSNVGVGTTFTVQLDKNCLGD